MVDVIKLLELMSARMFHDLAGPIGAVNNSIEFFEEDNPLIKEKALQIIKSSSHEAILRLKFFRQAYGTVNDNKTHLSDIESLIGEFLENTKLSLSWNNNEEIMVNSYIAKSVLNFTIIAASALIYGGVLDINFSNNAVIISAKGEKFVFTESTRSLLEGDISGVKLASSNIQIYYTYMMIENSKAKLSINQTDEELTFVLNY